MRKTCPRARRDRACGRIRGIKGINSWNRFLDPLNPHRSTGRSIGMQKRNIEMLRTMFVSAATAARRWSIVLAVVVAWSAPAPAQKPKAAVEKGAPQARPTRATLLRGEYGPYRANNDLLYYHLDVRVDPVKQLIGGKNTIRFRMLKDDSRIQLDLQAALAVDKVRLRRRPAQVRAGIRRRLRRFSRDIEGGWGLFHRLLLFGEAERHVIPEGPGKTTLDLHVLRDARRQRMVAQQGPVARRG